jgi:penicillin-binding protein 1C
VKPRLEPLAPPPPATLLLSTAQLPQPLRQFRSRSAAFQPQDGPAVAFPPNGAEVELLDNGLLVRVQGGRAPFTWLADGLPVATALRDRSTLLRLPGTGFVTVSVIDALGQSARSSIRITAP